MSSSVMALNDAMALKDTSPDAKMPKLQSRLMTLGSITLVLGLSLWLMEEAYLLAPKLVVFPKHAPLKHAPLGNGTLQTASVFPNSALPLGVDTVPQAVFSAIAISGFPLGGLAIRPSDKYAIRALLRTWVGLCLMLGTIFTATSVVILTYDNDAWREPGAEPLRYRVLIHLTNAVIAFYFAHRFSRGLQLPHAQALQWAWKAGHTAGALIAVAWPVACLEALPLSLDPIEASWESLLFVLPSAALVCFVALTSSPLRAHLLRWIWAGRRSLVVAVGTSAEETATRSDVDTDPITQSAGMASLWCGLALLAPPLWAGSLALMSSRLLATLATREVEMREGVQFAHLMLGVVHAIVMRGHWAQGWIGAWATGVTLFGDGAVFGLRLGDASFVWLPVRNACLPFLLGWLVAELSARVRARQLEGLRAELGEATALLVDERRRSAEFEEARRSALVSSALAHRFWRVHQAGSDPECAGKVPDDAAASDGTDADLQSTGSSEDMFAPTASWPRGAAPWALHSRAGVPPSLPPGPPSCDGTSLQCDELELEGLTRPGADAAAAAGVGLGVCPTAQDGTGSAPKWIAHLPATALCRAPPPSAGHHLPAEGGASAPVLETTLEVRLPPRGTAGLGLGLSQSGCVTELHPGKIACASGGIVLGDRIIGVDGVEVTPSTSIVRMLPLPHQSITLRLLRVHALSDDERTNVPSGAKGVGSSPTQCLALAPLAPPVVSQFPPSSFSAPPPSEECMPLDFPVDGERLAARTRHAGLQILLEAAVAVRERVAASREREAMERSAARTAPGGGSRGEGTVHVAAPAEPHTAIPPQPSEFGDVHRVTPPPLPPHLAHLSRHNLASPSEYGDVHRIKPPPLPPHLAHLSSHSLARPPQQPGSIGIALATTPSSSDSAGEPPAPTAACPHLSLLSKSQQDRLLMPPPPIAPPPPRRRLHPPPTPPPPVPLATRTDPGAASRPRGQRRRTIAPPPRSSAPRDLLRGLPKGLQAWLLLRRCVPRRCSTRWGSLLGLSSPSRPSGSPWPLSPPLPSTSLPQQATQPLRRSA